ncbi:MAG TPA: acyl-CoA dehydrogenase [Deltaproteobacteria bacterium]|nr:MAG: acyl-CoA dehydrogenase [Desulfobacteraceae bacterium 4484_190.1]HDM75976.1 acyl-CoA dehydrogenase [Deltaproteobacteria bacterium]
MGFQNEKEYLVYKQSVSDFLWKEVDPLVPQMEETNHIPKDVLFPKFREKGLFGLIIPEEYGGMGLNTVQYLPILAELSKVSGAIRALIHVHLTSARAIVVFGREEQKKELLPKIATGELSVAFAITEANSGTGLDCKTTAVRKGDDFILNGEKHLITNADFTKLFMVACYTGPRDLGRKAMSAILVDLDTPGFTNDPMPHIMGCKGLGHGILIFKDCVVPAMNIVGEEGQGLEVFLGELEASRVFVAASSLGTAERALELSLDYAKKRVTFGKPIASRESIRSLLADMAMDIYGLKLMLEDVARKIDEGKPCPLEASIAKTHGLEMVCRVTDKAMLVHGGRSYLQSWPIERLFREARLNVLEEGTPSIQRMVTARALLSGQLPWALPW